MTFALRLKALLGRLSTKKTRHQKICCFDAIERDARLFTLDRDIPTHFSSGTIVVNGGGGGDVRRLPLEADGTRRRRRRRRRSTVVVVVVVIGLVHIGYHAGERGVGERFGQLLGVLDVVTAAAPLEVAVGRLAWKRAAVALLQLAGSARPRHRSGQRSRSQSVDECLLSGSCIVLQYFKKTRQIQR